MPDGDPRIGMTTADLAADVALLATVAREGGAIAMGWFHADPQVWEKSGGSPVSEADYAVDRHLRSRLEGARPGYGWLSEESADGPDRLATTRQFVVDPIDGTRAFLRGDPQWAVSIAVVEAGRPIAAALYQPAADTLWLATAGGGATRDGTPLHIVDRTAMAGARIAGPRRYLDHTALKATGFAPRAAVPSLALRIAHVADGRLDVAYGTGNAHDWDLAAADLLVQEAGGRFTIPSGETLHYNRTVPRHPPLVAAVPGLYEAARVLLARLD